MIANIDADEGVRITGWIVPDNPSVTPTVIVVLPDGEEAIVHATILRADVVDLGFHHGTGMIGFVIDSAAVPNLQDVQELQLLALDGRIPIYRRFDISSFVESKLCFFDCSVMPQRRIAQNLRAQFALTYNNAQLHALETLISIVNNPNNKSVVITGRPNFTRYDWALRNAGYKIVALLRDPYEELAERLIFINLLGNSKAAHLLPQFVSDIQPLAEFARDLPLDSSSAMTAKFRAASPEQRAAISNPLVRMLGCGVDEIPEYRHVSTALDNLATMDLVGTRARFGDFRSVLKEIFGTDILGTNELEKPERVAKVQEMLSGMGIVSDLLEHDLHLYSLAVQAVDVGLDGL